MKIICNAHTAINKLVTFINATHVLMLSAMQEIVKEERVEVEIPVHDA